MPFPFAGLTAAQPMVVRSDPVRANNATTHIWSAAKKPLTGTAKPVAAVAAFSPSTPVDIRPVSVLGRFGKVSTPLIGSAAFFFAQRWSWVRYFWAFEGPQAGSPLRLSQAAATLSYNKRQALSEDLGIALGIEVAVRELRLNKAAGTVVEVVDIDDVLSTGVAGWNFAHAPGTRMRPDYVLLRTQPGFATEIFVLECKGSHSSTEVATLHKASHQVQGLRVAPFGTPVGGPGWVTPTGYISATTLDATGIEVEFYDPPGDESWNVDASSRDTRGGAELAGVSADGSIEVAPGSASRFKRLLRDVNEIQLLTIAGRNQAATQRQRIWRPDRGLPDSPDAATSLRHEFFGDFDGASMRLPLANNDVAEIFLGVEKGVADALERDADDSTDSARGAWRGRLDTDDSGASVIDDDRDGSVTVAFDNGLLMHARPAPAD